MAEQQWEYCELYLRESKEPGVFGRNMAYDCFINYSSPNGDLGYTLSKLDKPLPFNPFSKAIGLLGAAGWELVSIQHGTGMSGWMSRGNRVAYFKRPSMPGRAVNDPKLSV